MDALTSDWIRLGSIVGVHGVQGWIKVFSDTSPPQQILEYQPWLVGKVPTGRLLEVCASRCQGKKVQVALTGIDNRDQAEVLVGSDIFIEKSALPKLSIGEFYWHELTGLTVINASDQILGSVASLMETGANDVLVVKGNENSIDSRERLIPYVEERVVKRVDLTAGRLVVEWLEEF